MFWHEKMCSMHLSLYLFCFFQRNVIMSTKILAFPQLLVQKSNFRQGRWCYKFKKYFKKSFIFVIKRFFRNFLDIFFYSLSCSSEVHVNQFFRQRNQLRRTEPVFVNLLRSRGIDSQPSGGPVRQPYFTYRPLGYKGWRNRFLAPERVITGSGVVKKLNEVKSDFRNFVNA